MTNQERGEALFLAAKCIRLLDESAVWAINADDMSSVILNIYAKSEEDQINITTKCNLPKSNSFLYRHVNRALIVYITIDPEAINDYRADA